MDNDWNNIVKILCTRHFEIIFIEKKIEQRATKFSECCPRKRQQIKGEKKHIA